MSDITHILKTEGRETIERWCRSRAQIWPMKFGTVCRVLGTYLMLVPNDDISVAPHLCLNGTWETWIAMAVARRVRPGSVCVDVGANAGFYSILLADLVGEGGRVEAFEPQPDLADCIKDSAGLNGFKIGVHQAILSDLTGSMKFGLADRNRGISRCMWNDLPMLSTGSWNTINVAAYQLDDYDFGPIDFVKIDVEGAEGFVWKGMQETLARSPKIQILMEYTQHQDQDGDLRSAIEKGGFGMREVLPDGQLSAPKSAAELAQAPEAGYTMLWIERPS